MTSFNVSMALESQLWAMHMHQGSVCASLCDSRQCMFIVGFAGATLYVVVTPLMVTGASG